MRLTITKAGVDCQWRGPTRKRQVKPTSQICTKLLNGPRREPHFTRTTLLSDLVITCARSPNGHRSHDFQNGLLNYLRWHAKIDQKETY
jgi:hypothetical protein